VRQSSSLAVARDDEREPARMAALPMGSPMTPLSCADILAGRAPKDAPATIAGWVRTRRDSKAGISFVHVSDGSSFHPVQVVAPNTLPNYTNEVLHLTAGCAIEASGTIVPSPAKGQPYEMQARAVRVIGWVDDPDSYPIQPKPHTLEFLREVAHLRPRTNVISAATRVRHTIAQSVHRFFDDNGFFWIHTPIITSSDAEGAGELFRVSTLDLANLPRTPQGKIDFTQDFFGREAFLTVSGQLNVEAYCLAMSKVYTFGPTFRAENSNTPRHLAEFWMIEPEMAFCDLQGDMDLGEEFIKAMAQFALGHCAEDLALFARFVDKDLYERLKFVIERPFQRIPYTEAVEILKKSAKQFNFPVDYGQNLQSEHERFLTEEHFRSPVTVFNYPRETKPFYMRLNDDAKTVTAMDVLVPGIGEVIGGAQREERLDQLLDNMKFHKLKPEDYWWYVDLRKYGTVPHAGFGLGFERLLMFLTGVSNIRDVIPFARTPGSAEF
jgi:asparaginyl-tRNA synthetase